MKISRKTVEPINRGGEREGGGGASGGAPIRLLDNETGQKRFFFRNAVQNAICNAIEIVQLLIIIVSESQ